MHRSLNLKFKTNLKKSPSHSWPEWVLKDKTITPFEYSYREAFLQTHTDLFGCLKIAVNESTLRKQLLRELSIIHGCPKALRKALLVWSWVFSCHRLRVRDREEALKDVFKVRDHWLYYIIYYINSYGADMLGFHCQSAIFLLKTWEKGKQKQSILKHVNAIKTGL